MTRSQWQFWHNDILWFFCVSIVLNYKIRQSFLFSVLAKHKHLKHIKPNKGIYIVYTALQKIFCSVFILRNVSWEMSHLVINKFWKLSVSESNSYQCFRMLKYNFGERTVVYLSNSSFWGCCYVSKPFKQYYSFILRLQPFRLKLIYVLKSMCISMFSLRQNNRNVAYFIPL